MGVFQDTYLIPTSHKIVTALNAEGASIAAEAEKRRKAAGKDGKIEPLGPPAPQMFMALIEALENSDCGSGNIDKLKNVATSISAMDLDQVSEIIFAVKVSRTKTQGVSRLTVAMERGPNRRILIDALKGISGVDHKQGVAPANYLEEEIADWVSALDNL